MADEDKKELDPSPKIPEGEAHYVDIEEKLGESYGTLSPNPKLTDGLVDRTGEQPNGSESTNPDTKPTVFKGNVYVEGGKLYVNGVEVTGGAAIDTKGFDVLELSSTSGTLTDSEYALAQSNQCVIKVSTQYFYREFVAATLISYKAFPRNASYGTVTNEYIEITKSTKAWTLHQDIAVKVNPTLDGTEDEIEGIEVSGKKYKAKSGGGGSIDSDVQVYIESNYSSDDYANRTNYADPISLQEFITNCEAGNVYTNPGIIARITNLLSETTLRIILVGTNADVLAYNDTEVAKTTWQFLDMPEHNVRLGLPFNVLDWVQGSGRTYLKQYLEGTNESAMQLYPSNMDGLISAQGLLQVCHVVFEELPDTLKRHIKTVRRYYYRRRNYMEVAANGGSETNNGQMCQLACNVFHLSRYDLFGSGEADGKGSQYPYFNSNARRIRFYNGSATSWWNASPNTNYCYYWYFVNSDGSIYNDYSYFAYGVAPAFCI